MAALIGLFSPDRYPRSVRIAREPAEANISHCDVFSTSFSDCFSNLLGVRLLQSRGEWRGSEAEQRDILTCQKRQKTLDKRGGSAL